ncbi:hypothetical protein [Paracraurococcus ruber]|uniref:Uncharacterized protein n=1 Tax=Paracraurococcus ruber TaxID=77675 RepID=A0ABS1CRX7_9PROT|nr:hypothetical protein [Paracraurococcus ruber]MBK1656946.1 hypothetical protein [Paracraurococcus ruber]TDG34259.1 hypothetical protein E2C05_00460 [Paracraurococcus ruber]
MPFSPANLNALIQTGYFSLWHYRTTDTRATASAAGYFAPVAASLKPGDLMILQAADAMALVPLRSNAVLGTGVTLDGAVTPVSLLRSVAFGLRASQAASAIVRTLVLAPLAAGFLVGGSIPVSATVTGPVAQVVFSLRDATGSVIPPAQTVAVTGGTAAASFPVPPVGSGYRIRVEDASDPSISASTRSFSVAPGQGLILLETGDTLVTEAGDRLSF